MRKTSPHSRLSLQRNQPIRVSSGSRGNRFGAKSAKSWATGRPARVFFCNPLRAGRPRSDLGTQSRWHWANAQRLISSQSFMSLRDSLNHENGTLTVGMEVLCEGVVHLVNAASLRNPINQYLRNGVGDRAPAGLFREFYFRSSRRSERRLRNFPRSACRSHGTDAFCCVAYVLSLPDAERLRPCSPLPSQAGQDHVSLDFLQPHVFIVFGGGRGCRL